MSLSPLPILIVNPNTTTAMTDSLENMLIPLIADSSFPKPTFYTCPAPGIASINSSEDCQASAEACLPHLIPLLPSHSGVLVACYSHHPLVRQLSPYADGKPILGIFEASVLRSMAHLASTPDLSTQDADGNGAPRRGKRFGIVSTGKVWESLLTTAVNQFFGSSQNDPVFAGVETTGLTAVELHDSSPELVKERTKDAVKRLLRKGDVGVICLGCAGFAGMDETVREAAVEELGHEEGAKVKIVDGVKAGYFIVEGMVRSGI